MVAANVEAEPVVRLAEIADTSRFVGTRFAVSGSGADGGEAALAGTFRMLRLRPGIVFHSSDARDLSDMVTSVVQQPGLTLHFFLSGAVDARLGGRPLGLGRRADAPVRGVITARAEPELFERRSRRGEHVRKVNVTMTNEWLEACGSEMAEDHAALRRFAGSHLAQFAWTPSPTTLSVAEQLLRPPCSPCLLQSLYLESRSLDLVAEGFAALTCRTEEPGVRLRPNDHRRLRMIEDYIETRGREITSLEEIARSGNVSVSTLRRLFRAAHGMSVFEYLRRRGLERARAALERQGVAVAEAAYIAGYSSAANFATAFKRRFGLTPTEVRRH
ncbi:helix-turn-helix transcriptional regulator [Propylenella binzhouense]|uniref:AraC family transcriptional regulator n=1 Tax=Propylenella binzhouense TaxID=2555902 RepID=A0A964T1Q8_9HYPH|nr:AraC family transcriptional regulator [Propylenella binzhouense]MYZ46783.1 AraC family transcriptional regulator [Propylenella binzhouense]